MPRTAARSGPQTRAKILEVSTPLFLERGFDSVTVTEIAKAAGVSSVTVFNHFPTKEDLFLDRSGDAETLLRSAIRDREPGVDALEALRGAMLRLIDDEHPFTGISPRSIGFFRTVIGAPTLVARARSMAASLEAAVADELGEGGGLLAALFVHGYASVFVESAAKLLGGMGSQGSDRQELRADHTARVERLFSALRDGVPLP